MMPGGDNDCHFPHNTLAWQHFSARLVVLWQFTLQSYNMVCSVSSTQRAAQASIARIMPDSVQRVHLREDSSVRRRWAFLPVSELAPFLGVGQNIYGPRHVVNDWRAENTNGRLHTKHAHQHHLHMCAFGLPPQDLVYGEGYASISAAAVGDHSPASSQLAACCEILRRASGQHWNGWADPQCYKAPGSRRAHIDIAAGRVHVLPGHCPVSDKIPGPDSGACVCKHQEAFSLGCCIGST